MSYITNARVIMNRWPTPKCTRRMGRWNVRTMYAIGNKVMREMRRYHDGLLGLLVSVDGTGSGKIEHSSLDHHVTPGDQTTITAMVLP